MNKAYVMWQDKETREWFTVGCLSHDQETYIFRYTQGAKKSPRFQPFPRMDEFSDVYTSTGLFPLFASRLLPKSRQEEHKKFIGWLGLENQDAHPITILARSEGRRETDSITLHACPEKNTTGRYCTYFFSHGIRHGYLPENTELRLEALKSGDSLFTTFDVQNTRDPEAILLRTDDPIQFAGYCPRYLVKDFKKLQNSASDFHITVAQVNLDAPSQFKLLCKATATWPEGFSPCSGEEYQPIA